MQKHIFQNINPRTSSAKHPVYNVQVSQHIVGQQTLFTARDIEYDAKITLGKCMCSGELLPENRAEIWFKIAICHLVYYGT